jgi:hypothetical protein
MENGQVSQNNQPACVLAAVIGLVDKLLFAPLVTKFDPHKSPFDVT